MKYFRASVIGLAILALVDFSCHKHDEAPTIQPTIEGRWISLVPVFPQWKYAFSDHILTQEIVDFSATITTLQYPYATRHDTILIGGDANNPARVWKVTFHCDSVAEIHNITPGVLIDPVLYLRKVQ